MIRLRIKEVAVEKKISMRKLAKNADISYNTLRTIYRDPYRQVTTTTLDKLALALNVDVRELIESVPDDPQVPPQIDT
ncbi:XRE family transcriptional regulator [Ktedonosporobacter rubrisoli]|uniref:XRE family transcriptional regulator n=1 Tax=Ktedonosporobacter rubrisoli TaxID=2509675 RepID=A0A4P6K7L8_KTERU|nr:XRE family transcriptional regulator [Ktedonosporobacter rubrisoli]